MAKIKEIREIKPKMKVIEKTKEGINLEEDIEKAEEEINHSIVSNKGKSAEQIMGSNIIIEERTQIQEENLARTELEKTNKRKEREYAQTRPAEEERKYSATEMTPAIVANSRKFAVQETSRDILREPAQLGNQQSNQILEREDRYQLAKEKKKIYPWER